MTNGGEPGEESAAERSGQGAEADEAAARRKSTRALMEAGEKFHALVRGSAYAYVELDLEGNITSANRRAAEATGYTAEELVTLNLREFILSEDLERAFGDLEKALSLPNAGPREYRMRRKDGALIDVEVNTLPLKKGDRFAGYQITATEITARKRAEEALRESREELRYVIDNTWDIIFRIDLDGNYTFANRAAERLAGYSGEELLSMNMLQLIAPEHRQLVLGRLRKRMAGEPLEQPFDFEIVTKAGERVVVELTTTGIHDKDGELAGVQGIARDATERKRAEEALKESEERFRAIFDNATDGILLADLEDRQFHTGNKRICRMLGYTLEELRTLGVADIHPEKDVPYAVEQFEKQARGEIALAGDIPVKRKDGSVFYADISSAPVTLRGTTYLLGIFRDITKRKRAEEALRESEEFHRTMVGALPEAVTKTDLEGRITYVSPQSVEVYCGESADELLGKSAFILIAPEDRERAMANLQRTLKEGVMRNLEYTFLRKDGTRYPGEMSAAVVRDADGNPKEFIAVTRDVTERRLAERRLREAEERRDELAVEVAALRTEMRDKYGLDNIIAQDPKMREVFETVLAVGPTQASVFIHGETGTGKELIAKAVHYSSPRRDRPFVKVDCGALAETLLESELFGHVKGAFTNAIRDRSGRFEIADGGTIFLDEIHNMSARLQAKLLRVAQEGRFERVGSSTTQEVDVRIVSATNQDLEGLVDEDRFRKDLYYRLNVVPIRLPPLRDRRTDVPLLAQSSIRRFAEKHGRQVDGISREAVGRLTAHDWPGNVRELENVIEQAVVLCAADTIGPDDLRLPEKAPAGAPPPLPGSLKEAVEDFEKRTLVAVMERSGGGKSRAAGLLGISRSTLYEKLKRHGLLERRW